MPAGYQDTAVAPQITGGPQTAGSTDPSFLSTLGNLTNLGGSIYGILNSANLSKNASTAFAQSNPFGGYRPVYGAQLLDLMQNPASVTQLPEYKFLMDQGVQAIDRSAAAPGGKGLGSGGEMTDLLTYGQGLASESFMSYAQLLSKLAGADINPANPAQALQAQGGAATGMGSSIAGLSNSVGSTLGLLQKLFPSGTTGGSAASGIGNLLGPVNASAPQYGTGFDTFSSGSGYNPTTGQYSGISTPSFGGFSQSSGYDPTTGQYSGGSGLSNLNLGDMGGGGMDTQPVDMSDMWSNPKAAGGEAATSHPSSGGGLSAGSLVGDARDIYGIYGGVSSGSAAGYAGAAVNAGQLTNSVTGHATIPGVGIAGDALGIYGGVERGGVAGYTSAAVDAYKLYSAVEGVAGAGASAAASGAGAAASGAAASGAAAGAEGASAGATAGSAAGSAASAVSAYLPVVGFLLSAYFDSQTPAYELTPKYWEGMMSSLKGGKSNPAFYGAAMQALNMPQDQVPGSVQQMIYNSGFLTPGAPWGMTQVTSPDYSTGLYSRGAGTRPVKRS